MRGDWLKPRYVAQGALLWAGYALLRLLPFDLASDFAGWLFRTVGPRLAINRNALANLELAMPELDARRRAAISAEMWDNLGRMLAEYPRLSRFDPAAADGRVTLVGAERLRDYDRAGRSVIVFTAHTGNWELTALACRLTEKTVGIVYREQNNPYADRLIAHCRRDVGGRYLPKGPEGARAAMAILKQKGHLGFVADQRLSDGIEVPFLGLPAMTAPAMAQLALRYRCVIAPVRVERLRGSRFRVTVGEPFEAAPTGDKNADVLRILRRVNDTMSAWIRERPGQWLWLHRRWRPVVRAAAADPAPAPDRAATGTS